VVGFNPIQKYNIPINDRVVANKAWLLLLIHIKKKKARNQNEVNGRRLPKNRPDTAAL
jgi:hypothetical protein